MKVKSIIKAVYNAVPSYAMNCFKFPKKTCMELDSSVSGFFWGKQKDEGRVHWLAWHKLTKSKKLGGLGFKDFSSFNDALLAKHTWRLLNNPEDLWAKKMRGLHFPNGNTMIAKKGSRASWGWSSLLIGRDLLASKLVWRVGNGNNINIWNDKWVPKVGNGVLGPAHASVSSNLQKVSDLIVDGRWELENLKQWISEEEYSAICCIPLSVNSAADKLFLDGTENGSYSAKSGYIFSKTAADNIRH